MNPNKTTLEEFVKKLDGKPFKASPNRQCIAVGEVDTDEAVEL